MKITNSQLSYLKNNILYTQVQSNIQNSLINSKQLSPGTTVTADDFSNLDSSNRLQFLSSLESKNNSFLNNITKIIVKYVTHKIGSYEFLDVNKQPYKSFITTRIGDLNLYEAKLYKKPIDFRI
jgi:hypothetical protein